MSKMLILWLAFTVLFMELFLQPLRLEVWRLGRLTPTPDTQRTLTSPRSQRHSPPTRRARSFARPQDSRAPQLRASSLSMSTSKKPVNPAFLKEPHIFYKHWISILFTIFVVHCTVLFILQDGECNKLQHNATCYETDHLTGLAGERRDGIQLFLLIVTGKRAMVAIAIIMTMLSLNDILFVALVRGRVFWMLKGQYKVCYYWIWCVLYDEYIFQWGY